MKKKINKKAAASAIVAGTLAATAVFLPGCNRNVDLYGPPPEELSSKFDPAENENLNMYGPPPIVNEDEEETTFEDGETDTSFTPEENTNVPLYGPPPAEG